MKCLLLYVILLAQWANAQQAITCFNVVDEKGNALNIDGENAVYIQSTTGFYFQVDGIFRTDSLAISPDRNGRMRLEPSFFAQPKAPPQPFDRRYLFISHPHLYHTEVLVTRRHDGKDETMRIVFTGQQKPRTAARAYVVTDIVFKPGIYELDCRVKKTPPKQILFAGTLPMEAYYMKNTLNTRKPQRLPPRAFRRYHMPGFTFNKNGSFTFSESHDNHPPGLYKGNGRYELNKTSLILRYGNPVRTNAIQVTKGNDNLPDCCNLQFLVTDQNNEPVPFATVMLKAKPVRGINSTNPNGVSTFKTGKAIFPAIFQISASGYGYTELPRLDTPGNYTIRVQLDHNIYIDSGRVDKVYITDRTKDYIVVYRSRDDAAPFDPANPARMNNREIYYHKRILLRPKLLPD